MNEFHSELAQGESAGITELGEVLRARHDPFGGGGGGGAVELLGLCKCRVAFGKWLLSSC